MSAGPPAGSNEKIPRMTLNEPAQDPKPAVPAAEVPAAPVAHHHGFGYRLRNYFLTGLIVAGPLAITVYLTWSFITWVDDLVRPFMPVAYRPETYLPVQRPGTSLVRAFVADTPLAFPSSNLVCS